MILCTFYRNTAVYAPINANKPVQKLTFLYYFFQSMFYTFFIIILNDL